ncbi:hypothetical protein GJ496_003042 [Pomphorhynchus laevis]|nr:hypothetical protein GJ496_003042 [Pomphorhynchus laevis]
MECAAELEYSEDGSVENSVDMHTDELAEVRRSNRLKRQPVYILDYDLPKSIVIPKIRSGSVEMYRRCVDEILSIIVVDQFTK